MARINIEESLHKDNRFFQLAIKLGGREIAMGCLVYAWAEAQRHYLSHDGHIPKTKWKEQGLNDAIIECGLAEMTDRGIRLKGTDEQFVWLKQRSKAGKKNRESASAEIIENSSERPLTADVGSERETSSYSYSSSYSSSLKNKEPLRGKGSTSAPSPKSGNKINNSVGYFIAAYARHYAERYGGKTRPVITGQTTGRIKTYLADTPLERACAMIKTYCAMDDNWFVTKSHDFETFMGNLNKVSLMLDTVGSEKQKSWIEEALEKERLQKLNQEQESGGSNGFI